jgi:autotransporter-associated beta strand protein
MKSRSICNPFQVSLFFRCSIFYKSWSRLVITAATGATALLSHSASATSISWNGTTGGLWSLDTNWSPVFVPSSLDDLTILGPGNVAGALTINVDADAAANSINFTNTASTALSNLTSGSNKTLTLGVGGLTTGTGAVTIGSTATNQAVNIALAASQSWNIGAGGLTVTNAISGTGFGITKTGAGILTLAGANTYSGATAISVGTVEFQGASAMSTTTALSMANGTTLSLKSDVDATFAPASFSNLSSGSGYTISVNGLTGAGTGKILSLRAPSAGGGGTSNTTLNVGSTSSDTLKFTTTFATNSNSGSAWGAVGQNVFSLTGADVILDAGVNMGNNGNGAITVNSTTGNTLTINGTVTTNTNRTTAGIVNSGVLTLNNTVALGGTNQGFFVIVNGGTLNVNNAGSIRNNANIGGTGNRAGLTIAGGTLNNTSGSAKTLSFSPTVGFNGDFAFSTSGGTSANDLNLGTGATYLGTAVAGTGATRTITTNGSATLTIGGVITSNGATPNNLTKAGTGTLVLNGNNATTYLGATTVKAGTLVLGNAAAAGAGTLTIGDASGASAATVTTNLGGSTIANNIVIAGSSGAATIASTAGGNTNTTYSGTVALNKGLTISNVGAPASGNTLNFTGAISGTGSLTVDSGSSAFTNLTWLKNSGNNIVGNVALQNAATLGTVNGALNSTNVVSIDSTSQLNTEGESLTIAGLNGSGTVVVSSTAGSVLTLGGSGTYSYGGVISNAGGLTKSGGGTQTLTGANTYAGATTISSGTLLANNTTGSAFGTSNVTVDGTGTLGGTRSFTGSVTINSGGTLSPGASIESLSGGALTMNTGSIFSAELDSSVALGVASDLYIANGDLSLSGLVALDLTDLASVDTAFAQNTIFSLLNYSGTWNGGLFSYGGNALADGATFTTGLNLWQIDYNATDGGSNFTGDYLGGSDSFVNLIAVPEPSTWMALTSGLGVLLLRRRRA